MCSRTLRSVWSWSGKRRVSAYHFEVHSFEIPSLKPVGCTF